MMRLAFQWALACACGIPGAKSVRVMPRFNPTDEIILMVDDGDPRGELLVSLGYDHTFHEVARP